MNERKVWASYASFRLVECGTEFYIEDAADGSVSSPLHATMVRCLIDRPENLLDIQLLCATPRATPTTYNHGAN